jgi:hypothetical protein
MTDYMILNYVNGFLASLLVIMIIRTKLGLKLRLYFINEDSPIRDQSVIPVVYYNKKKSLLKRNWSEDIELVLTDENNTPYHFNIQFGLFRHYYLINTKNYENVTLNNKRLKPNLKYSLNNRSKLMVGKRLFTARVTLKDLIKGTLYA